MGKYRNRFCIGDEVISTKDYAYIPIGTRVRVVGVTSTGSIKIDGISGTYSPDNFKLASKNLAHGEFFIILDGIAYFTEHDTREEMENYVRECVAVGYTKDELRVYQLEDNPVDISYITSSAKKTQMFYVYGHSRNDNNGKRYYAVRKPYVSTRSAPAKFGVDFKNKIIPNSREEGDQFTLTEALELLRYYNDPDFTGWIYGLALEPVNS